MARSDRRPFLAMMLALLLVSTTPIGTGGKLHEFDLVHPLFTHLHLYQGRLVTHEQLEQALRVEHLPHALVAGPAFAPGSALPADDAGPVVSPTLPLAETIPFVPSDAHYPRAEVALIQQLDEAPPDPPPPTPAPFA